MATLPVDLAQFGRKVTSQNDEDGVVKAIVDRVPMRRYFVEFGVHPTEGNCLQLIKQDWNGLFLDGGSKVEWIKREFVSASNIMALLRKYQVPDDFGLLSIDIDGQDLWVWQAIEYKPQLVIIEYNGALPIDKSWSMPYNDKHSWDRTDWYGASLLALSVIGNRKGYTLVYANGVNAFFVRSDAFDNPREFKFANIYRPTPLFHRHDDRGRQFVEIT